MDLQLARKKFETGYDYISQCHTGNYQESLWQLVQSQILEAWKTGIEDAAKLCNNKKADREKLLSELKYDARLYCSMEAAAYGAAAKNILALIQCEINSEQISEMQNGWIVWEDQSLIAVIENDIKDRKVFTQPFPSLGIAKVWLKEFISSGKFEEYKTKRKEQ
jgi:hypothetical protein